VPDNLGYVVVVRNQASHQIEDTLPSQVLHFNEEDAAFERDLHTDEAEQAGRKDRYIVCEVIPVEGSDDG
jgi:hypothetical protein